MNTLENLRQLFVYNDWANRRLIFALKTNEVEKARGILAHLLITEAEYFERLYGKDSTGFHFWRDLNVEECGKITRENREKYERLLNQFDDEGLDLRAAYKTSEGVAHENSFREMLTHVLFHSATHRGQVVKLLREAGFEPPPVDYIIYLRET